MMMNNNLIGTNFMNKIILTSLIFMCGFAKSASIPEPKKDKNATLWHACKVGDLQTVKEMLEAGAKIETKNKDGFTCLHIAVHKGNTDVVKMLMEEKANLEAINNKSCTPVLISILNNNINIAQILINAGAKENINNQNDDGWALLHYASANGFPEIVQLLLKNNADPNIKDLKGLTPLHEACGHGKFETVKLLLDYKADKDALSNNNYRPLHYIETQNNIDPISKMVMNSVNLVMNGGMPLLLMTKNKITAYLFEIGAIVENLEAPRKVHSLHIAAITANKEKMKDALSNKYAKSGLNKFDHNSYTPLMWACARGNTEFVQQLLKLKYPSTHRRATNPHLKNGNKDTAMILAHRYKHKEIVAQLYEYLAPERDLVARLLIKKLGVESLCYYISNFIYGSKIIKG